MISDGLSQQSLGYLATFVSINKMLNSDPELVAYFSETCQNSETEEFLSWHNLYGGGTIKIIGSEKLNILSFMKRFFVEFYLFTLIELFMNVIN